MSIYPGTVHEGHPEVFTLEAMPPQPTEKKPGQLSQAMLKQFFEEGYVIVENFFKREELDAVREGIKDLVEVLAQKLYKAGKITKLYKDYGLFQRLTKIEEEFPGTNILLHKNGKLPQIKCEFYCQQNEINSKGSNSVESQMDETGLYLLTNYMLKPEQWTPKERNKSFKDLWSNERLLNVIEQIIGPEIAASPVWNLRTKTPKNEATVVPWHQDSAYFDNDSYSVLVPTAWIPLLDTDEFNGGMQVAKGGNKSGKVCVHQCCYGNTWYVMCEEEELEKTLGIDMKNDVITCKIPYGSFLLFNNITPHRSLPNVSNDVRWALDLRWQRPDKPYGLFGLKDGVVMRSPKNPNLKIDWESFEAVNRTTAQQNSVKDLGIDEGQEEEFDRTLQGPWMKKWEITHQNVHTDKHRETEKTKQ